MASEELSAYEARMLQNAKVARKRIKRGNILSHVHSFVPKKKGKLSQNSQRYAKNAALSTERASSIRENKSHRALELVNGGVGKMVKRKRKRKKIKLSHAAVNPTLNTFLNAKLTVPMPKMDEKMVRDGQLEKFRESNDRKTSFSGTKRKRKEMELELSSRKNNAIVQKTDSFNKKLNCAEESGEASEDMNRKLVESDSVRMGESLLSWLISPVSVEEFLKNVWEKKPLYIARNKSAFYSDVCTMADLKAAVRKEDMYFTKNIDVTSYVNGTRVTENPVGKAVPSVVWKLYKSGKSIRLLNPQTFLRNVRALTTGLQDFFRCFVGANMYLTPPNSQGFAPHFDDIEAFVLQLDGIKEWKLYNPRSPEETLPRESSPNFTDEEIGQPVLEVTLEPGDLLYFPRGMIHQARCLGEHSLHITVSCYQKNSWADLLEKAVPIALQRAMEEDIEFREGLPLNYLDHLGLVHSDSASKDRERMLEKFNALMNKLIQYCPIDASADQMGKGFVHDSMPPFITVDDVKHRGSINVKHSKMEKLLLRHCNKKLGIKLIRAYACRLLCEEDALKMYFNTHNSHEYHGEEPMCVELSVSWAAMAETLIKSYPEFTDASELLAAAKECGTSSWLDVVQFVCELSTKGLLLFDNPLW